MDFPLITVNMQQEDAISRPGLMSLPRELRDSILRCWFKFDKRVSIHEFASVARGSSRIGATKIYKVPLMLCKQLRSEALEILYGENRFRIEIISYALPAHMPPAHARRRIRHVEIALYDCLVRPQGYVNNFHLALQGFSNLVSVKLDLSQGVWFHQPRAMDLPWTEMTRRFIELITDEIRRKPLRADRFTVVGGTCEIIKAVKAAVNDRGK